MLKGMHDFFLESVGPGPSSHEPVAHAATTTPQPAAAASVSYESGGASGGQFAGAHIHGATTTLAVVA